MSNESLPPRDLSGSSRTAEGESPRLSARLEPFDSYWQAPEDVEAGYRTFYQYYRYNLVPLLPEDKTPSILVVSCGPGYLVQLLTDRGYESVLGIDSDPVKVGYATARNLNCRVERAFPFVLENPGEFDVIICEQELNHLTKNEMVEFLQICQRCLKDHGLLIVYGLNGANPITGAEALAQNFDHFNTFTEYSLKQVLEIAGFQDVEVFPLNLYVFYSNPLNYLGLGLTWVLELFFRISFKLYGKKNRIFSKKIGAVCRKAGTQPQ
jgi:SAM-dependent methyltransferase